MTEAEGSEVETLRREVAALSDALRKSEARVAAILESVPFDLWVMNEHGEYELQNSTSRAHWGAAVGKRPETTSKGDVAARWQENNRRAFSGETVRGEVTYVHDGEARDYVEIIAPVLDDGRVRGIVGVNIDVTDSKRLAAQWERAHRAESLALFAGGIAHDFNNTLAAVMGATGLLQREVAGSPQAIALLHEIDGACDAGRGLTRQLLTYARGGAPQRRPVDLATLLAETSRISLRGTHTRLDLDVAPQLPVVEADPAQLQQVVQNLVLNASQAMGGAGTVRVSARGVTLDAARGDALPKGAYVRLAVEDHGSGISDADLPRIFDPYYSTKEHGHGLGLAVVQSIVARHGGTITATSDAHGTCFEVHLPASSP